MSTPIQSGTITTSVPDTPALPVDRREALPSPSRRAFFWQFCTSALVPFLVVRLFLLLIGVVTAYYIEPLVKKGQHDIFITPPNDAQFPNILWTMWARFDSGFYMNLAQNGYWSANTLHGQSNWVFFPLYPLLVHLLAVPFASHTHAYLFAGIAIANVSAIAAIFYLYKLTILEFNASIAARAVFYLGLFPMSFFLSAVYPESLFLVLAVAAVYYARQRRWWLSSFLAALAALNRPHGVLLIIVIGWEYWQVLAEQYAPLQKRWQQYGMLAFVQDWFRSRFVGLWLALRHLRTWLGIAWLLQIPLAFGLFCLYAKWQVGTFLPFEEVEKNGWGRSFTTPWHMLKFILTHPSPASPYDWTFYGLNVVAVIIFLLLLIPIFFKLPSIYRIFALVYVIMPLSTTSLQSITRFYMTVFPVYLLLAWWTSQGTTERQMVKHNLVVAGFAILLAVATVMWTLGIYSMS